MRKGFKKFIAIAAATVMAAGALSLAACGEETTQLNGYPDGEVISNGGFVVEKKGSQGDYYYFINGSESYTADNTYGTPVKGALMRVKVADVQKKDVGDVADENNSHVETVVPSLMVAGTYDAGIRIFGDRVYYATPNNVPDPTTGELLTNYLSFKSAKLDGSDVVDYFSVDDNTLPYRFVEAGAEGSKTVYVVYVKNSSIYSYNTATETETLLVKNASSYQFNADDVTDPTIYYTMTVSDALDTAESGSTINYNQIYRVSADATEAPYTYSFDETYIEEELDGELPYVNLGEIVLDGIDSQNQQSGNEKLLQFSHPKTESSVSTEPTGYRYTLRSYKNGGIYFTRTPAESGDGSPGSNNNGVLYFVPSANIDASWDSILANDVKNYKGKGLEMVAGAYEVSSHATTSALYYIKDGAHHYVYTSGSTIHRVDVNANGGVDKDIIVAEGVSGATPKFVQLSQGQKGYDYLYFSRSNGTGVSVERAVINGDVIEGYDGIYGNIVPDGVDPEPYKVAKVLNVKHLNSWYPFELIGTQLFYADTDSDLGGTGFNYIATVSLDDGSGELMDNVELAAFTKKYDSIMGTDSKEPGLFQKLSNDGYTNLATALRYYFLTGERSAFDENIDEAIEKGDSATELFSEDEKNAFTAFIENKSFSIKDKELFGDQNTEYRQRSYFITQLGRWTETDLQTRHDYWKNTIKHHIDPAEEEESAEEESGLPGWAWALIGIGIAVVVILGAAAVVIVISRKKEDNKPHVQRMAVDTTDDRSVDVYSDDAEDKPTEEAPAEEAPAEEAPAEEAPAEEAPAEEAPAEAPAEEAPAEEAPAEAPAEPSEEKPQE